MTIQLSNVTFTNITIENGTATFQGSCPATPELEKAVQAGFSMWKPTRGHIYCFMNELGMTCSSYWHDRETDTDRYESGIVFPDARLLKLTYEAERITRRLNQAAVVYGGAIGRTPACNTYASIYDADASVSIVEFGYFFISTREARKFEVEFHADLTRLAELNSQLTEGWRPFLNPLR